MQAVILAGGKGTRLAERLNGKPKPLVDVCGVPLMQRQLETLSAHGVDDFVVLVNHAANQIESFFTQLGRGDQVTLVDDGEPRGTAGATLACLDRLADRFIVVYGDTLFDIDIAHMLAAHDAAGADATLLLHPNDHPADSDLVEIDESGQITCFHAYPHAPDLLTRNLVNAAFYVVEKSALADYAGRTDLPDFAKHLFPEMARSGSHLHGYVSFEYIKDLGTPKRLDKVEKHLLSGAVARARRSQPQQAVFLDRDGTLNVLRDYVRTPDDLELIPNAAEAVRRLNSAEYRTVLVTNQPVLARGECDTATMRTIHAKLETELGRQGAYLDGVYMCPHHPHAGFRGEVPALKIECKCRKPGTGMIDQAAAELNIDLNRSWMVGDSSGDMLAAERAGLLSVLVQSGERGEDGRWESRPDFVVKDVAAAAHLIAETFPLIQQAIAPMVNAIRVGDVLLVSGEPDPVRLAVAAALRQAARGLGLSVWFGQADDQGPPPECDIAILIARDPDVPGLNVSADRRMVRIRVELGSKAGPSEPMISGAISGADLLVVQVNARFSEGIFV